MSTKETVHHVADELRQRLADLEQDIKSLAQTARDAAGEKLHDARVGATEFLNDRRAQAVRLEKSMEQCIAEQPVKAVLFAVGAGFLLGFLWKRR